MVYTLYVTEIIILHISYTRYKCHPKVAAVRMTVMNISCFTKLSVLMRDQTQRKHFRGNGKICI